MKKNNPRRKTRNVKDSDRQTREICERFRLKKHFFACLLLRQCLIGFPKMFCSIQNMREGETLLHEGEVAVFGVLLPKKFEKHFFSNWCSAQFKFLPTLPIPHSLILRKNHAPISFSCVDIADFGFF